MFGAKSREHITDYLIENFYNEILKNDEKEILKIAFSKNLKQSNLDELLKIWDIEVKGAHKSLMLAYIMKMHPDMKFSEYEEPRLKGLLKFFRFQNMNKISHYIKIVRVLNEQGIVPLILKGGAMKHIRQDLPRVMGDIDILVPEKDFMKSAEIALSLGYAYKNIDIHSIDIHKSFDDEEGIIDIHKFIYMNTGYEQNIIKDLFARSRKEKVFSTDTLIPCNEDMVFIALVNLARNMRDKTSQNGLIYTIFDCAYLINQEGFNWEIIKENARKAHCETQVVFAIKFIKKVSENIFPDYIQNTTMFEKETLDYSTMVIFNRFYLDKLRQKSRSMKFKNLFKGEFSFKDFIAIQPKYLLLKQLRKHPLLIQLFIKDLQDVCR